MMHKTPPMTDFLRPILQWASKHAGEFSLPEIAEEMANYFDLSPEARNERTAEDNAYCFYDKTKWSINLYLKKANLLESTKRGHYKITDVGRREAFSSNKKMTPGYLLRNFPAYGKKNV